MMKSEMLSQGSCLLTRHYLRLTTIQSNIYISYTLNISISQLKNVFHVSDLRPSVLLRNVY